MPSPSDAAIDAFLSGASPTGSAPARSARSAAPTTGRRSVDDRIDAFLDDLPEVAPSPQRAGMLGTLGESARNLPKLITEGVPAAARAFRDTQEAPTYGQSLMRGPMRYTPIPGALDLGERALRLPTAFGRAVAEVGPEQAKPLTEALASNAPFLGRAPFSALAEDVRMLGRRPVMPMEAPPAAAGAARPRLALPPAPHAMPAVPEVPETLEAWRDRWAKMGTRERGKELEALRLRTAGRDPEWVRGDDVVPPAERPIDVTASDVRETVRGSSDAAGVNPRDPESLSAYIRAEGGLAGHEIEGVPLHVRNRRGRGLDEIAAQIADAQGRNAREVEREITHTLQRYRLEKGRAAESAATFDAPPPTREPLKGFDIPDAEWARMGPAERRRVLDFVNENDVTGRVRPELAARLGTTAGGAALGGTQGDTPGERARNAALGAAAGFAAPSVVRGLRNAGEAGALTPGQRIRMERRAARTATETPPPVTPTRVSTGTAAEPPLPRGAAPRTPNMLHRVLDDVHALLAPATRGPDAARMASILRPNLAELAQKTERAQHALKTAERAMEAIPEAQRYAVIDAIEHGRPQPNVADEPLARTLRTLLDGRRGDVQGLGTGKLEHFIEDYFPHLWKDPTQAQDAFAAAYGRRPLAGSGSFLKQRTIPTVAEGRAMGLEPVTSNPVTATLLKLREMDRYVMGQTVLKEMQEAGLARLVPYDSRAPGGWAPIHDKIARVGSAGRYWAPEPAARVLNNHLSPGLQGSAIFDAFRGLGNTLNQAQLGFSAFHLGFVSVDTMISKTALGLQQLAAGRPLQAAKSILETPLAPFTTYLRGSKVLREYYRPGAGGEEMAGVIDHLIQAGGRARMDRFYGGTALDTFWKAMHGGRYGTAAVKAFPAALEAISKPVMEEFVPRVKLGVFADLAEFELSKLPPGASRAEAQRVLGRAWDSVDNRLGQLVYDNLFWNRTLKDLLLASVRSVGWNLGTIREIGGGITDTVRQGANLARGRGAEMTPRMAYTAALPFITGLYGAVYQYAATGEGPRALKDYFFPRTGRLRKDGSEDRVSMPSYMKDVYAYSQHPWTTVKHKLNPSLGLLSEMLENEDFYGAQIRNPDDPLVRQLVDEVDHVARGFESFSFRGFRQQTESGASPAQAAQGFVGITPAPASITRDAEQQRAIERKREAQSRRKKERRDRREPGLLRRWTGDD